MQSFLRDSLLNILTVYIQESNPTTVINLNEYKFIPAAFGKFLNKCSLSSPVFSSLFSELKNHLLTKCQSPNEVHNYCQILMNINNALEADSPMAPQCLSFVSDNIAVFV